MLRLNVLRSVLPNINSDKQSDSYNVYSNLKIGSDKFRFRWQARLDRVKKINLIILILLLASILRLKELSTIPVGFNDDEAAFGYNAYSILKTGKDEWGKFLPFPVFESFGDWKLVFYLYSVIPSVALFGLNEFSTRLPSVFFGVLSVLTTFLLSKKLFNSKIALIASFLLAISPWHIAASRNAFESDLLIFTIPLATYFFLKGLKKKGLLTLSFVVFGLSFYIYRSAWIFIPIFVILLVYLYRKNLKDKKIFFLKNIVLLFLIVAPLIPIFFSLRGQSRFIQESFISGVANVGIYNQVNTRRGICQIHFPNLICVAIYNKYSFFVSIYMDNLISNLSPQTYYQDIGSTGYQAFAPRGYFYTFEYLLLVAGLFYLLKQAKFESKILLSWIVIAALAPSLTGVGNPGRLNIIMPIPQIIAAIGLFSILNYLKRKRLKYSLIIATSIIVLASFSRFVVDSLTYYPVYAARYQRYGYKDLFLYLESEKAKHSQIAISRHSDNAKQYIHYLFFTKYDPQKYQRTVISSKDKHGWESVDQIENIKFYASAPSLNELAPDSLIVTAEKEISTRRLMDVFKVDDPKGDRVFNVYTINTQIDEE